MQPTGLKTFCIGEAQKTYMWLLYFTVRSNMCMQMEEHLEDSNMQFVIWKYYCYENFFRFFYYENYYLRFYENFENYYDFFSGLS